MSRTATVFGLLAIAVTVVATIVLLSDTLDERPVAVAPGTADGASGSYFACSSCDAHHQRLRKDRSGKE